MTLSNLYDQIGEEFIRKAIETFYQRAFADLIIGHFFFGKNHAELAEHQIAFTIAAFGGPRLYRGRSLFDAHHGHKIRAPHFERRRVIMKQVLEELDLRPDLRDAWLSHEESFRSLIINS